MLTRGLFVYILLALCVTPPSLIASPTPGSDVGSPGNPPNAASTPVAPPSPSSGGHPAATADSPALNGTTAAHSPASAAASPPQTPKDASPSASAPAHVTSSTNPTVTDNSSKTTATDATAAAHPAVSADPSGATPKPQGTDTTVTSRPPTSESAGSSPNTVVAHSPASADSTAVTPKSQVTNLTAVGHPPISDSPAPSPKLQGTNDTAVRSDSGHAEPKALVAPGDKVNATSHAPAPAVPTCFTTSNSKNVESHHCDKALEKVLYAANQTLDKFSTLLFVNYKTCNINVLKPRNATVNKLQLVSMVHNITAACSSQGGAYSPLPKISVRVERGTKENTYEVDRPVCKRETCPLTWSDCLSAFHQIPEDPKGFVASANATRPSARITSGNCTVTLATTDHSAFSISRQFFYPTFKKLLNECGNHPGKIYQEGGALGYNGDVKISMRPSNKELCN